MAFDMRRLAGGLAGAAVAFLPAAVLALTSSPNDYFFPQQWALHGAAASTQGPSAWCASTGAGVTVADVDTGADFGHPDLAGKLLGGAAFLGGTGSQTGSGQAAVQDGYGHGTMTTGIVVADTNNGRGIAGEAPDARALIVKVLDNSGSGYEVDVAAGVRWAVDHGAQVINLSLGSEIPLAITAQQLTGGDPLVQAVDYAAQHGRLVVLAAGNQSLPGADYTSVDPEALVVGGLGPDGSVAFYSNSGTGVNLYAPGGDNPASAVGVTSDSPSNEIISTYIPQNGHEDQYAVEQGTSFAAPYTSGVAALLVARGYTPLQARARILASASSSRGVPQLNAKTALGACPAGSTSGTGTGAASTSRQASGIAAPPPAAALPAAAVPSAPAAQGGGAASEQPAGRSAPNPVVARVEQIRRVPTPVAAALVILGTACLAGAAVWFFRSRVFTQP